MFRFLSCFYSENSKREKRWKHFLATKIMKQSKLSWLKTVVELDQCGFKWTTWHSHSYKILRIKGSNKQYPIPISFFQQRPLQKVKLLSSHLCPWLDQTDSTVKIFQRKVHQSELLNFSMNAIDATATSHHHVHGIQRGLLYCFSAPKKKLLFQIHFSLLMLSKLHLFLVHLLVWIFIIIQW